MVDSIRMMMMMIRMKNIFVLITTGIWWSSLFFISFISLFQHYSTYPMPQMRICIQSIDPTRLPSQCIYCKSRTFPITVRMCTGNSYLPARMTLNEASCLITTCRKQLPRYPPEPYSYIRPMANNNIGYNNNNHNSYNSHNNNNAMHNDPINDDDDDNDHSNDHTNGSNGIDDVGGNNGGNDIMEHPSTTIINKIRKPAKFFLGKPQKIQTSIRPFSLYG
ncbi:uncharacterized protein LOC124493732 [Dermatophagoides farinae]|uniref:uncharacterized protein LOC124493732 n=1 Tax=Dermatophagoides farinae TaxID=6954 RepID=UPI003F5F9134